MTDLRAERTASGSRQRRSRARERRVLRSGSTRSRAGDAQRTRSTRRRLLPAMRSWKRPRCLVSRWSAWLLAAGMCTGSRRGPPKPGMAASTWASARSVGAVLREVPAQRLDALALHARDLDARIREPMSDREPAHAGGLHDGLHGVGVAEPGGGAANESVEGCRVVAEAQRRTEGSSVLEDLGDGIAADGEIDADGSRGHRKAPWLGKNRAPLAWVRSVIRGRRAPPGPRRHNRVTLAPSARPGGADCVTVTRRSSDLSGSSSPNRPGSRRHPHLVPLRPGTGSDPRSHRRS